MSHIFLRHNNRDNLVFHSQQFNQNPPSSAASNNSSSNPLHLRKPLNYFASLLRKFKGRLSSVHGLKSSTASSEFSITTSSSSNDRGGIVSSFATLPRKLADSVEFRAKKNQQIENFQDKAVAKVLNSSSNSNELSNAIQCAQIFGTLPRDNPHQSQQHERPTTLFTKRRRVSANQTCPIQSSSVSSSITFSSTSTLTSKQQQQQQQQQEEQSHLTDYLKSRSSTTSGCQVVKPVICYAPSSVHSLATLPRSHSSNSSKASYFWEEPDVTKQCHSLVADCRRALDGVGFAAERFFNATSSPSLSSANHHHHHHHNNNNNNSGHLLHLPPLVIVSTGSSGEEDYEEQQENRSLPPSVVQKQRYTRLVESCRNSTSQLLLVLVELRNLLNQSLASSSSSPPLLSTLPKNPQRQQQTTSDVVSSLLVPVGALLAHLIRLSDSIGFDSSSCFFEASTPSNRNSQVASPTDSAISMHSTASSTASSTTTTCGAADYAKHHAPHPRPHPHQHSLGHQHQLHNQRLQQQQHQHQQQQLGQQTAQVVNSLRETLNRIDEGIITSNGSSGAPTVRKSTSVTDDFPVTKSSSLYKTTLTVNTSGTGGNMSDTALDCNPSNKSRCTQVRLNSIATATNGHNKLAALERNLKTVSFDSATRSTSTGFYDNVECYSPGPEYLPKKQQLPAMRQPQLVNRKWSNSAELFIEDHPQQQQQQQQQQHQQRQIPIVFTGQPSKPPLSPNQPVWLCRQPEFDTSNNNNSQPKLLQNQHSNLQSPAGSLKPAKSSTVATTMTPNHHHQQHRQLIGQGSFQDILLMEPNQVENLLEFSDKSSEKGSVRNGPVDALIVYASLPSQTEAHRTFVDAFLTTYCTFVTAEQLVDKLIYRFEKMATPNHKLACSTLCLLVHVVSSLSQSDALLRWPLLRSRLAEFVYSLLRRPGLWHLAVALRRELLRAESSLQALQSEDTSSSAAISPMMTMATTPVSPGGSSQSTTKSSTIRDSKLPSLLDLRSRRIAEQMTLIDWKLFEALDLSELLQYASSSNSLLGTPRLSNLTRHFNDVSLWARTVIVRQSSDKFRERYMLKLAKVVQHLRQLQNFNSSLALLSALDSGAVIRLISSARVLKRIKAVVESLRDLTDSSGSFKAYRSLLEQCHPPAIPYLGLTLSDLTFLHLGAADHVRDDVVNFEKRLRQHRILESVRRFKASHAVYNFSVDRECLLVFGDFSEHWDEETCWSHSERIKPRQQVAAAK